MIGATGSIGRLVVDELHKAGIPARALARDPRRAESVIRGAEIVGGDLTDPATLANAVAGVDAIIFTHGSMNDPEGVDYGGVRSILEALQVRGGPLPTIALMTSISVTRATGAYADVLGWKRGSERLVRASGAPYTIVRPGWFDLVDATHDRPVLHQGDVDIEVRRGVRRSHIAQALVAALTTPAADHTTLELFSDPGAPSTTWDDAFAALVRDNAATLSGGADAGLTLDDEPRRVRADVAALQDQR